MGWYNAGQGVDMFSFSLPQFISLLIVLVVGFTVHEFSHAWTADYFGDDTPRLYGRLTLNPLAHLDILGSLMLLIAGFGWAKPVPINPYNLERHSRSAPMLVALAGPVSNLLMAIAAGVVLSVGGFQQPTTPGRFFPSMYELLWYFVLFNLILFFFNLVPLFPLDGEKVLMYLLPPGGQAFMESIHRYGSIPLLVVVLLLPMLGVPVFDYLVFRPAMWIANLIT
jgi:Zn-dependent protease